MINNLDKLIEEKAETNGLFAIAYALTEVARAGDSIARQLDRLGMNEAYLGDGAYGAVEGHTVAMRDSYECLTEAVNEIAKAITKHSPEA